MFSCGALIQSQSYRGGHAQIGRDRQRLKKERKFGDMSICGLVDALSIKKTCTTSPSCSSEYAEVLGLGIVRTSDMLYKCLPTIRTSLYGRKIGANVYIHDVASSPGLSSS